MKLLRLLTAFILTAALTCFAVESPKPTIYIEPQEGFETYLVAAISKKAVPVDIVTDKTQATYVLQASPVEVRKESTGGKVARCIFAYCAGIEDRGSVSVQLIESNSTKVAWAYSVNKQRGHKNDQSMAEAVAKHLKEYFAAKQSSKQ